MQLAFIREIYCNCLTLRTSNRLCPAYILSPGASDHFRGHTGRLGGLYNTFSLYILGRSWVHAVFNIRTFMRHIRDLWLFMAVDKGGYTLWYSYMFLHTGEWDIMATGEITRSLHQFLQYTEVRDNGEGHKNASSRTLSFTFYTEKPKSHKPLHRTRPPYYQRV